MKKAVSMFLAAALAVGTFAGCGSSADTGSTGSAASTVQQQFMVLQL